MTTTRPPAATTRRWVVVAIVLLALVAAAANPVVRLVSGRSIGALMAEQSGSVRYDRYDGTAAVPPGVLPTWFPTDASVITVVRPGPKAGSGDSIRVDAAVPAVSRLPAACGPSPVLSVPFALPSDWPRYSRGDLRTCGPWTVLARSRHLYLWRELPSAG